MLEVERDANGNIIPDAKRFPTGMKAIGDHIHSKGLKFGIYFDAGKGICFLAEYLGLREQDLKTREKNRER